MSYFSLSPSGGSVTPESLFGGSLGTNVNVWWEHFGNNTKGSVSQPYSRWMNGKHGTLVQVQSIVDSGTPVFTYNGSLIVMNGKIGIGTTSPVSQLDVAGDIRAGTTIRAINGIVLNAMDKIPTNSIPASTSTYTNWVMINWTNAGPVWIATNIYAAGSFLRLVPSSTLSVWP